MKKKERKAPENRWMDTYGDMVTLLLCFFILLFSISTVNAEKWIMIVRSLNPESAKNVSQLVQNKPEDQDGEKAVGNKAGGLMTDEENFNQVYWTMREYVEDKELEESIEVKKGKDFTFIIFRNNVFFDGDSYVLKEGGKKILDVLCDALKPAAGAIGELKVMGHTNQVDPNKKNEIAQDRFLSSNRATEVLVFIEKKGFLGGKELVSLGLGQHYPIASFVTEEDRAKNRRVEIYITKNNASKYTIDEIYENIIDEDDSNKDIQITDKPSITEEPV